MISCGMFGLLSSTRKKIGYGMRRNMSILQKNGEM